MAEPRIPSDEQNDTYEPSELEATRKREQDLGAGQTDMDRQREATKVTEQPTFQSTVDIDADLDEPASGGLQQGVNHTRREGKSDLSGPGPKTLAAQRRQQKRAT